LAFGGSALQVVETDEHAGDIIVEQAHHGLFNPFSGLGILAEMNLGKIVEVLGAVEMSEHLSAIREGSQGFNGAVARHSCPGPYIVNRQLLWKAPFSLQLKFRACPQQRGNSGNSLKYSFLT